MIVIPYSSSTAGNMKGVMLTHRNLTTLATRYDVVRVNRKHPAMFLITTPFLNVYRFVLVLRVVVMSNTMVPKERCSLREMLTSVAVSYTHLTLPTILLV